MENSNKITIHTYKNVYYVQDNETNLYYPFRSIISVKSVLKGSYTKGMGVLRKYSSTNLKEIVDKSVFTDSLNIEEFLILHN